MLRKGRESHPQSGSDAGVLGDLKWESPKPSPVDNGELRGSYDEH